MVANCWVSSEPARFLSVSGSFSSMLDKCSSNLQREIHGNSLLNHQHGFKRKGRDKKIILGMM
uniref:Uncharacterized protein n=1 Tax=Arundo donax TaxID=35708 RepID=A0A0A9D5W3_ARUDO